MVIARRGRMGLLGVVLRVELRESATWLLAGFCFADSPYVGEGATQIRNRKKRNTKPIPMAQTVNVRTWEDPFLAVSIYAVWQRHSILIFWNCLTLRDSDFGVAFLSLWREREGIH